MHPIRAVFMGVSGSGKSFIGSAVAKALALPFLEGDGLHPPSNIAKMEAGIPLTDEDRWPWLDMIGAQLAAAENGLVVSCSALKRSYRDRLRHAVPGPLAFVYLYGDQAIIRARMAARTLHFMPVSLLDSQIATLEVPTGEPLTLAQNVELGAEEVVSQIVAWLSQLATSDAAALTGNQAKQ